MLTVQRLAIAAPDGETAFLLEKRLSHLRPTTVGTRDGWFVELDDDGDRLDEIVAAVEHWLREAALRETTVEVGGETRTVSHVA